MRLFLAKNRLDLRNHCTVAELESYRQGALSSNRQEVVSEHLAVCEDCTILLLYAVTDDLESWDDLLEQEIEEGWNRLRPRLENGASQGHSLARLIGERRLPLGEALPLVLKISRALALLHSSGRAHPDLRAENVIITPTGEVHLLERGFAPTSESLEIGYGRSAEAVVIDLYPSLSPEQLVGEEPDQRSNLFSLGVLMYELLTGVSPFRAGTPLKIASRILSLDPDPARDLIPAIPPEISLLLERLLAKEPADRPSGAAAVVHELEYALDRMGPARDQPQAENPSREDEIERLYDEIIALVHDQIVDGQSRDDDIERSYSRLRELQATAAREFRTQFEASLAMPIDAGKRILDRAHALREELENLAARDAATRQADTP
jgi:hypothetical protein